MSRVVVLEAQPRIGGRVHTVTFDDGVTAEARMEEFWEGSPAYGLLQRLRLPVSEDVAHSSVILGGRLYPYVGGGERDSYLGGLFDSAERSAFLVWNATAGSLLAEAHAVPRNSEIRRSSFRDFVESMGLPQRVAEWIRVVVEAETAVEWHRIAALDGIDEMRPFLDTPRGFGERNAHVVGGNSRLIDALVSELPPYCLRTHARVHRIVDNGSGVEVEYEDAAGRSQTVRGEVAALTLPVWDLKAISLEPALSPAARAAIASTAAGCYVKVILRLRADAKSLWAHHGPNLFTLLSDSRAGCLYLSDSPELGGDLVLTMLIHGRFARSLTGRSPQVIARQAVSALERLTVLESPGCHPVRLLPDVSQYVTDARVFVYPRAVAYWPQARGRSRFDPLAASLRTPHGRVLIGGDTTESSHSDGAFRSAERMTAAVLEQVGAREVGRYDSSARDPGGGPPAERAKLRRELGRLDTIFFLISAMVVVDTIGAIAIGGGEAFTWLVVLFLFFFIPSALASAELGAAIPEEGAHTSGFARRSAGTQVRSRRCSTGPEPRCGSAVR